MSVHAIKCRETGESLANKLDGGVCVCESGRCEMREMRNREGDYARYNTDPARTQDFDATGFAIGLATGYPVSPRGITVASVLGALLHPTERPASYDVIGPADATDEPPRMPPAPVRAPDWSDNDTKGFGSNPVPVVDQAPVNEAPVYTPSAPVVNEAPVYTPSAPVDSGYKPDPTPSYSAPDPTPSYSAPDPAPPSTPDSY